ncbi:leucine-rich repeat receptor-like serine/threonine-protein kinase [Corchorus olitorius]|uniref:Leucine-rich repeat receptor-like serine/threonine-protein kinase n=1 Tax=Corchorus olitorius TaxID=93759 RepID=A0A1R3G981_9ROSI|nr:leucine-rich repeat receptor-like serine/threonine-protein kinase [Corchorus olitorius]
MDSSKLELFSAQSLKSYKPKSSSPSQILCSDYSPQPSLHIFDFPKSRNCTQAYILKHRGSFTIFPAMPPVENNSEASADKYADSTFFKGDIGFGKKKSKLLMPLHLYLDKPIYAVDVVLDFKRAYQVNKSWVGDPCGPKNYTWEELYWEFTIMILQDQSSQMLYGEPGIL